MALAEVEAVGSAAVLARNAFVLGPLARPAGQAARTLHPSAMERALAVGITGAAGADADPALLAASAHLAGRALAVVEAARTAIGSCHEAAGFAADAVGHLTAIGAASRGPCAVAAGVVVGALRAHHGSLAKDVTLVAGRHARDGVVPGAGARPRSG
jgi:hypothetical protein